MQPKEYIRDQIVFNEGEPVNYIAIVKEGCFEIIKKIPRQEDNIKEHMENFWVEKFKHKFAN